MPVFFGFFEYFAKGKAGAQADGFTLLKILK
jgi:hypothetical protein